MASMPALNPLRAIHLSSFATKSIRNAHPNTLPFLPTSTSRPSLRCMHSLLSHRRRVGCSSHIDTQLWSSQRVTPTRNVCIATPRISSTARPTSIARPQIPSHEKEPRQQQLQKRWMGQLSDNHNSSNDIQTQNTAAPTTLPTSNSTTPSDRTILWGAEQNLSSSPSSQQAPITPLSPTILSTLPLLKLSSTHPDGIGIYATIHIHSRPYLVTLGDRIRLPFLMPRVQPGDILRLTHASTLGSRDYTLRGTPWVDSRMFEIRATVAGMESEPMRIMEKTKRRNRKIKHVKSKLRFTELLVSQLRVRGVEEIGRDEEGLLVDGGLELGMDGEDEKENLLK